MTDLFSYQPPPPVAFDGSTYSAEHDYKRLRGQLERVFNLMQDNQWRTLSQIADETGGSEASISARLRDLRKGQYGGRKVEKQRVKGGLWLYRLGVST